MTKLFIAIAALHKNTTWVKQLQLLIICNFFPLACGPLRFCGPPQLQVLRGLKHSTAINCGSRVMRRNVYSSAVFAGVDRFALKFCPAGSSPIKYSWRQKNRNTGLPDGKDRTPLRSLVLTQYRSVTDGRICRSI